MFLQNSVVTLDPAAKFAPAQHADIEKTPSFVALGDGPGMVLQLGIVRSRGSDNERLKARGERQSSLNLFIKLIRHR